MESSSGENAFSLPRYMILAPDLPSSRGKSAQGVLAYRDLFRNKTIVCVIDPKHEGKVVSDVVAHIKDCSVPIVDSVQSALKLMPDRRETDRFLLGVTSGSATSASGEKPGDIPHDCYEAIREARRAGLHVINGLHEHIAGNPKLQVDGDPPVTELKRIDQDHLRFFSGKVWQQKGISRCNIVGSDIISGKMTAAMKLTELAQNHGDIADVVPTGQTGRMIRGEENGVQLGVVLDAVPFDYLTGALEEATLRQGKLLQEKPVSRGNKKILFVEGQAGVVSNSTFLRGSAPDSLILVHDAARSEMKGHTGDVPMPSYKKMVQMYEDVTGLVKPAKVAAVVLNTGRLPSNEIAQRQIDQAREETGLPVIDLMRSTPEEQRQFYEAIRPAITQHTEVVKSWKSHFTTPREALIDYEGGDTVTLKYLSGRGLNSSTEVQAPTRELLWFFSQDELHGMNGTQQNIHYDMRKGEVRFQPLSLKRKRAVEGKSSLPSSSDNVRTGTIPSFTASTSVAQNPGVQR